MDELRTRIIALFAALYFFILCLPYGNEPVKVELTYELKTAQTQYTDGDKLSIQTYAKNIGRPFYGHQIGSMKRLVFQSVDGERKELSIVSDPYVSFAAVVDQKVIIKHGEVQSASYEATLQNAAPGWYSLEVIYKTYDGTVFTQVFENVFEVV